MPPLPNVKDIIELVKTGATIQAQEQILQLRQEAVDCQEENLRLRAQLADAERKLDLRARLTFDGRALWLRADTATPEGPYCQLCHDRDGKLIRMHEEDCSNHGDRSVLGWHCYGCKNV